MNFSDLQFQPHSVGDGVQAKQFFPNGYGVSVVRFTTPYGNGSYGSNQGLYELAVLQGTDDSWKITYDTPITSDVLGWLNETEVEDTIKQVFNLPSTK